MENKPTIPRVSRVNFSALRRSGVKAHPTSWLTVYCIKNEEKRIRFLWNLGRKTGNAVVRNRLKRWCKEFFRLQLQDVLSSQGLDLNLVFRPVQKDFYKELRREEIIKELFRVEKAIRKYLA